VVRPYRYVDRITGYPNPFETYMLLAAVVQGCAVASGYARSPSIEIALDGRPILRWVWAALLAAGGMIALAGLYWRGDPFNGVEIKRAGLIMVGFGAVIYGAAALLVGPTGTVAGLSAVGFAVACFDRAWQVTDLLRRARAQIQRIQGASP
jgi:hypothetical protein